MARTNYKLWTIPEIRRARQWQREGIRDEEIASRLSRSKKSLQMGLARHDPGGGIGPGVAQVQAVSDWDDRRRGWSLYLDAKNSGRPVDWRDITRQVRGTDVGYRKFVAKCYRYGKMLQEKE